MSHFPGSMGIICVIGQFLASQGLTGDTIFGWLEFFVEVATFSKLPSLEI